MEHSTFGEKSSSSNSRSNNNHIVSLNLFTRTSASTQYISSETQCTAPIHTSAHIQPRNSLGKRKTREKKHNNLRMYSSFCVFGCRFCFCFFAVSSFSCSLFTLSMPRELAQCMCVYICGALCCVCDRAKESVSVRVYHYRYCARYFFMFGFQSP